MRAAVWIVGAFVISTPLHGDEAAVPLVSAASSFDHAPRNVAEPLTAPVPPSVLTGLVLVGGIIVAGIVRRRTK